MEFEGVRRTTVVPNLTPLIDIVFLLLVFFLLTSHFVRDESLAVDLPKATSGQAMDEDDVVEVVVDAGGTVRVAGEVVRTGDLSSRLEVLLRGRERRQVRLRGDRASSLEQAVAVLDAARRAGAEAVDILTDRP